MKEVNQEETGENGADEMNPEVDCKNYRWSVTEKRYVILRDERVGGRARVTTYEERVLQGGWREITLYR